MISGHGKEGNKSVIKYFFFSYLGGGDDEGVGDGGDGGDGGGGDGGGSSDECPWRGYVCPCTWRPKTGVQNHFLSFHSLRQDLSLKPRAGLRV